MNLQTTTTTDQDEADEQAAFAAGFGEQALPAAHAAGAETQEATQQHQAETAGADAGTATGDPASTEQNPVDPFAGLPPAVRELLAEIPALRSRTEMAEQRARESVGRVGALQREFQKLNGQTAADDAPAATPSKTDALRAAGLPEIADAIEEVRAMAKPEPTATQAAPAEAADDPHQKFLDEMRPTWVSELTSADFTLWLQTQPREFAQQVAATDNAAVILRALSQFDGRQKAQPTNSPPPAAPATNQRTRLAAGLTPQGDGRRAPRREAVDDDEEAAFQAGFHGRT